MLALSPSPLPPPALSHTQVSRAARPPTPSHCTAPSSPHFLTLRCPGQPGSPLRHTVPHLLPHTSSHSGVLGSQAAHSATLYRTFFPTLLSRWWAEAVRGCTRWICFDACPVHACLPYVARRIAAVTPAAKIVVMLRDPVKGVFSAEVRGRGRGGGRGGSQPDNAPACISHVVAGPGDTGWGVHGETRRLWRVATIVGRTLFFLRISKPSNFD